jgi:protein-tyrosine-phosphatase
VLPLLLLLLLLCTGNQAQTNMAEALAKAGLEDISAMVWCLSGRTMCDAEAASEMSPDQKAALCATVQEEAGTTQHYTV